MRSDDDRLGKRLVANQKERGSENSWYGETQRIAEELEIEIHKLEEMTKQEWKKLVKKKIQEKIERTSEE